MPAGRSLGACEPASDPLAPTCSEAHAAAAGQLEEQGDNKAALEMWTRAVAGDPTNPTL